MGDRDWRYPEAARTRLLETTGGLKGCLTKHQQILAPHQERLRRGRELATILNERPRIIIFEEEYAKWTEGLGRGVPLEAAEEWHGAKLCREFVSEEPPTEADAARGRHLAARHGWEDDDDFVLDLKPISQRRYIGVPEEKLADLVDAEKLRRELCRYGAELQKEEDAGGAYSSDAGRVRMGVEWALALLDREAGR